MRLKSFTSLRALAVGAAALTTVSLVPAANAAENGWYIPVEAIHTDESEERFSAPGMGGSLGIGYRGSESLAYELSLFGSEYDESYTNGPEWTEYGVRLAAMYYLVEGNFEPFIGVGIAGARTDLDTQGVSADETHAQADIGVGVDWNFTRAGSGLRAAVRYRVSFFDIGPNVDGFGIGNGEEDPDETQFILGAKFALNSYVAPPPPVLDTDGDGVNDTLDLCPRTPVGMAVDARGCIPDSDGDKVPDALDKCPNTQRGVLVDANGCPRVMDGDKDGVPDKRDQCPRTARGVKVYENGCAAPATKVLGGVLFKTDSANLLPRAQAELDAIAREYGALMNQYGVLKLQISGHTDAVGSEDYNLKLSQRRAKSAMKYLISKGIDASRIISNGYGETDPAATNQTKEGRQQNRRVVVKLLGR